ncbi:MAG: winged helix-turn-helix transcriptional regulator [Thermoplasmata archaeon]|nr:winged helix-turn-helix transcriptional regulator [Thermoplasmata archaeon]
MPDPLDLANRKRLFECVRDCPGLHFREIQRRTGLPIGVLEYHLNYLVQKELLTLEKAENFSRYYPGGQLSKDKQRILSVLRQEIPRGVVLYLLRNPGSTHTELLNSFTISGGTLSYHVKKLTTKGVVSAEKRGRESYLRVMNPDMVADLLIVYRRTFFDKLVDEFVARYTERD